MQIQYILLWCVTHCIVPNDQYYQVVSGSDEFEPSSSWRVFGSARLGSARGLFSFSSDGFFSARKAFFLSFSFLEDLALYFHLSLKWIILFLLKKVWFFWSRSKTKKNWAKKAMHLKQVKKICAKKAINLEKSPARFQLGNWDAPARLGSEPLKLGSARAGKFQLGLITITYT